jgi:hypothetical protein
VLLRKREIIKKQLLITLMSCFVSAELSLPKSSTGEFHPANVDGNLPQLKVTGETGFPFERRYDEEVGGVVCLSIYVQF